MASIDLPNYVRLLLQENQALSKGKMEQALLMTSFEAYYLNNEDTTDSLKQEKNSLESLLNAIKEQPDAVQQSIFQDYLKNLKK
jgi:hypothetical protein